MRLKFLEYMSLEANQDPPEILLIDSTLLNSPDSRRESSPLFFAPKDNQFYVDALNKGFAAAGKPLVGDPGNDFEVVCPVSVIPNDDVEAAADMIRPMLAGSIAARSHCKAAKLRSERFADCDDHHRRTNS